MANSDKHELSNGSSEDLHYWVALSRCPKLGPTRFALLRRKFATMAEAWQAGRGELAQAGLDNGTVAALIEHRNATDVTATWKEFTALDINVITIADSNYPKLLKEIFDPPAVLYYKGKIDSLHSLCLAVVGTRQATPYGQRAACDMVVPIASANVTIISGLAYGIDATAHQAALSAKGKTVAVLANGLDTVYPTAHRKLADDIISSGGALVSEFPPGVAPLKQNFVQRNRIIAGLASATLVIEGARESGALITARFALESNREVLALPGSIYSEQSFGTNDLLKSGAHLVSAPGDVFNVLGLEPKSVSAGPRRPLLEDEADLLRHLSHEPVHIDELARELAMPVSVLAGKLTALELAGYVQDTGGQRYVRIG